MSPSSLRIDMQSLMPLFVFIPLLGFFLSLILKPTQEKAIAVVAISTIVLHGMLIVYGLVFMGYIKF